MGSVVPDIAIGNKERPYGIIDFKTGKRGGISRKRLDQFRDHVFDGPGVVVEVGRGGARWYPVF